MSRFFLRCAFASGLVLLAATASRPAMATDGIGVRRIDLPSLSTVEDFPYTIEIPADWTVRREVPEPGVYLGPPTVDPKQYPEMIFVRWSRVDLSKPEVTVANIKANDTKNDGWSAPEVKVFDVGNVQGVWVLMQYPAKDATPARTTLTLKVPIQDGSKVSSVDIIGSAPTSEFPQLRAHFEKILRSVLPAAPKASKAPAPKPQG